MSSRAWLDARVAKAQTILGLTDWTIEVSDDAPDDPAAFAECHVTHGQHHAYLRFSADFDDEPFDKQNDTIAHELTHVHTYDLKYTVADLSDFVPPAAWPSFWKVVLRREELLVDRLAGLLRRLLPEKGA